MTRVSRRDFLRTILMLSGSTVVAACSSRAAEMVESGGWVTPTPAQLLPANTPEAEPAGVEDLEAFLALSALLTGVQNLDRDLGAAFLAALQDTPGFTEGLEQLYQQAGFRNGGPPESLEALESAGILSDEETAGLADTIATAWYTGVVEGEDESMVITFVDSLAMKALHFTKPLTICGTFGFWAEKPAADPPPVRYWSGEAAGQEGDS